VGAQLVGYLPLVLMIAVGIAPIVLGAMWFKRARGFMLRSLSILVIVMGAVFLIILAVAIGIHREPWTPLLVLLITGVVLAAFIFWISVLADCLLNEPNDGWSKVVWVLAIILTFVVGAGIYHLGRRPRRLAQQNE
jgi:glucose-6-phosphate-specific signal transduction histidine kinase